MTRADRARLLWFAGGVLLVLVVSVGCEQMLQNPTAATSLTTSVQGDLNAAQGPPLRGWCGVGADGLIHGTCNGLVPNFRLVLRAVGQNLVGCYDVVQGGPNILGTGVEIRRFDGALMYTIPGADGSCAAGTMVPLVGTTAANIRAVSQSPADYHGVVSSSNYPTVETGPLGHGF